jgi:carboxypeptidase PM20D1
MSVFKKILLGLGVLVALLVALVLYRTFTYGGAPVGDRVELPDVPAISADTAAEHLSRPSSSRPSRWQVAIPAPARKARGWSCMTGWKRPTPPRTPR